MSEGLFYTAFFLGLLLPVLCFAWRDKIDFRTFGLFPFILLVLFSSLYETVVTVLCKVDSKIWFRVYGLLEFACLYYYFRNTVRGYKKFFYLLALIYLVAFLYFLVVWNSIGHLKADSYLISIEVVFVFSVAIFWFKQLFREGVVISLFELSDFYFVSGLILYFSGTYILDLLGDYLLHNARSEFLAYWNLMIVFNIVLRVMLLVGLWKKSKK